MNVTLDDTSPQLQYVGQWIEWRPASNDPSTGRYYRGTFHSVYGDGAYMSLQFNGTQAWIYGSLWLNHGAFSAMTDGANEETFQGYTADRRFEQVLYHTGELEYGEHEVVSASPYNPYPLAFGPSFTKRIYNRPSQTTLYETNTSKLNNDPRLWLDVDYVVVQLPLPGRVPLSPAGKNVTTTVIDDTDSSIYYANEWRLRPDSSGYFNVTAHETGSAGAGFALPFTGSSIQLFGTIGPDVGNYTISIDGQAAPYELNGTFAERRTNSPLFFKSGLTDGPHELNLVNVGRGVSQQTFEFDYAVVNSSLPRPAGPNLTTPDGGVDKPTEALSTITAPVATESVAGGNGTAAASTSGADGGGVSVGAIAGGVVGGLAALALLGLLLFCWRRKKRESPDGMGGEYMQAEKTPISQRFGLGPRHDRVQPFEYTPTSGVRSPTDPPSAGYGYGGPVSRAALGTSIDTMSQSHVTYSSNRPTEKRGFDPASDVSSTGWTGSPISDQHHIDYAYHGQPQPLSAMNLLMHSPRDSGHPASPPGAYGYTGQRGARRGGPDVPPSPLFPASVGGTDPYPLPPRGAHSRAASSSVGYPNDHSRSVGTTEYLGEYDENGSSGMADRSGSVGYTNKDTALSRQGSVTSGNDARGERAGQARAGGREVAGQRQDATPGYAESVSSTIQSPAPSRNRS